MSLQRFDAVSTGAVDSSGPGLGSGSGSGTVGSETGSEMGCGFGSGGSGWLGRRWRGRSTPSTKSSSAERRLG